MARLVSVNVGLPKEIPWRGQHVYTGIWKYPVAGRRAVRRLNVDGDGQGDLAGHGGEHRAVFVYQTASYAFWATKLQRNDFTLGQFGENFTVDGLSDDEVRIGDRFRIGSAVFEVTQPRVTCYRVGIRMNDPLMPTRLVAEGRPGFYLRVLTEGDVAAGDAIELIGRDAASVTVAEVDALLYRPKPDADALRRAVQVRALSTGWRRSLEMILAGPADATSAGGLGAPDLAPSARSGFRPARIVNLARLTRDVVAVSVAAADSRPLDRAKPGQFIVVRTPESIGSPPIVRSYSLIASTESERCEIAVKCEINGSMGSYLSGPARVGDMLEMSAPRGSFVLADDTRPVVFMSAGIGITPVLAMLRSLSAARSSRRVWWLYGARRSDEHPFAAEVRALLSGLSNAHQHIRYSRPAAGDRAGSDFDSVGRLEAGLIEELGISVESAFYLCGPALFLRELKARLDVCGIPAAQVHSEVFGAGPALNPGVVGARPGAPHAPSGPAGAGPAVSFARSGIAANWDPRYASLLEFAEACDVPTRWSCRTGVCHTCESGLISGEVSYGPAPLQPPAPGNVLPCCSAPVGAIVLDL